MTREIQIPHDVEAEEAVLGSLLIDPELAFVVVEDALGPEDFFIQKNAWVYEAIRKLNRAGEVCLYRRWKSRLKLIRCGVLGLR